MGTQTNKIHLLQAKLIEQLWIIQSNESIDSAIHFNCTIPTLTMLTNITLAIIFAKDKKKYQIRADQNKNNHDRSALTERSTDPKNQTPYVWNGAFTFSKMSAC